MTQPIGYEGRRRLRGHRRPLGLPSELKVLRALLGVFIGLSIAFGAVVWQTLHTWSLV